MIGFDADHCLVKYNVATLVELLIDEELDDFIEMGYPRAIRDFFKLDNYMQLCLNASVYDIDNGLVI